MKRFLETKEGRTHLIPRVAFLIAAMFMVTIFLLDSEWTAALWVFFGIVWMIGSSIEWLRAEMWKDKAESLQRMNTRYREKFSWE